MKIDTSHKLSVKKILLYILGYLFLGIGIVGIFLPILPTTPFLLLAASVFLHTDKKVYRWMMTNKWFGPSFRNYVKNHTVSAKVKWTSLLILFFTMSYSIIFATELLWLRVVLMVIAILVAIHILKLKTIDDKIQTL